MNFLGAIPQTLLAVREDSGIVWGRFDHGRAGMGTAEWTIMIGAATLFVLVACVSHWRSRRSRAVFLRNSSSHLFGELARAHGLDRANRRLLKKLAAAKDVQQASTLFIEPEYFGADSLPAALEPSARELRQIRHVLFEECQI